MVKKLLILIALLPLFAQAQIGPAGTIQKDNTTKIVRGNFGSNGLDSIALTNGVGTTGQIPVYNSVIKKFNFVTPTYGSGTVTSITPGWGHTSNTPITTSGTVTIDSATLVASKAYVGNFTTKVFTTSTYQPLSTRTTVGNNFYTLTNPSAITFPRINADNSVSALDASTFRTAIGVGTGTGTVTSVSVTTANGVSGSVATATTTPAITLTLGAITPSSVNSVVLSGSSTPTLAVTGTSTISGTNTGDQTNITGNAGTATALQNARTIGTVTGDATSAGSSFNGTTNNTNAITVTKVNGVAFSGLATGILKNTTGTGVPSIATSADLPGGPYLPLAAGSATPLGDAIYSNSRFMWVQNNVGLAEGFGVFQNTGNTTYLGIESSTGGSIFGGTTAYATAIGTTSARPIQFVTNNVVRSTITPIGRVGNGITAPTGEFQVNSGVNNNVLRVESTDASTYSDILAYFKTARSTSGHYLLQADNASGKQFGIRGDGQAEFSGVATFGDQITSTKTGRVLYNNSGGTSNIYADFINTSGDVVFGLESSAGGTLFTGASAYAGVLGTETNTSLQFGTNNIIRQTINGSGNVNLTSLAGTGSRVVVADASGNLSASTVAPTSGTYTPTATGRSNVSSIGAGLTHYQRIGSEVSLDGFITVGATAPGATVVTISLPSGMTSNFTVNADASGVSNSASATISNSGYTVADFTNDEVSIQFNSLLTTTNNVYFHAMYTIK